MTSSARLPPPREADVLTDPLLSWVRRNVLGADVTIHTPFGPRRRRYFDQTASGQAFGPVEDVIRSEVLPMMSNTHTEGNASSRCITRWFHEAHEKARRSVGAASDDLVIFTGAGATGAVNKLIGLMGIRIPDNIRKRYGCLDHIEPEQRPLVIRSRMEHHSNDLPWRESIADTEYVGYDRLGRIDPEDLDRVLSLPRYRDRPLKIGSFSAASNVTGILTDVRALARVMHSHGGFALFDFAAAAPYVDVRMQPDDPEERLDGVFISMHKFLGGPQTPGLLVVNRDLVRTSVPVEPGGGTVLYTSPWEYRYLDDLQHREEGGTPPIVQVIRAGLVLDLKQRIGVERIGAVEAHFVRRAVEAWRHDPAIHILGDLSARRIGVLSVILDGGALHHSLAVRLMNDIYGIQVRGGCMCAGTYGHDLLGIDEVTSRSIRERLDMGDACAKPGWVRVSFSPATGEGEFRLLLEAVPWIARNWRRYAGRYAQDPMTAEWHPAAGDQPVPPLALPVPGGL